MRRVLMVTYHFPPVGGVGVERSLKHVTYLPDHGWEPVVVAPRNSGYRIVVPESVDRIPPGTEVHRAPTVEPAHVRRAVARLLGRRLRSATSAAAGSAPAEAGTGGLRGALNAAWAFAVPRILFPDEQLLWVPGAVVAGRAAHVRAAVDVVYSSSPPVSGHLAAAVLSDVLGVPWVADFRDPWMGNAFVAHMPAVHRLLQRHMERSIVARADRVLFATATWRDRYARRYPWRAERFVHVPNGYDPADLAAGAALAPLEQEGPRTLIYAGSVYGERELSVFLDGLALALSRDPGLRSRLRVDFVGMLNPRNRAIAEARSAELAPVVSFLGFRPRPEVIAMERAAHAGLILIADDPGRDADVNAKLYEYIGLDLPVLAVAPRGETRATLEELEWGLGVDPEPEAIADGIATIIDRPRPDRRADPDGRYDRRALTSRLAGILDEVSR